MSDENEVFRVGESFRGYVVQKLLGRGGIGAVYLAKHELLGNLYALKVLYPEVVAKDATVVKRFLREARLATRVRHPNLVAVHDCGHDSDKDVYYLVMDFVSGSSLRDVLAFENRIEVHKAVDIIAQVAAALRAAQAFHVVHRDIKPENIMIQPDGLVKLVDLGIAKADNLGDSLRTNTDSVFGTPSYVSPEQAICSANVDVRADIYSLGVVFFEMLVGRCPYVGRNPADILQQILSEDPTPDVGDFVNDVDRNVAVVVRRMIVKDRNRRIASFDALLSELKALGATRMTEADQCEISKPPEPGMKTLLGGLDHVKDGNSVDPLANADEDVVTFMATRQRKRFLRKLLWIVAVVCVALAVVCIVACA